jgi:hypothetical protein
MTHLCAVVITAGLTLVPAAYAQQKPGSAAEKEAEQQKAGEENMARLAAQQAEAVARAQMRVAEEARRAKEEEARRAEAKLNELIPLELEVVISRYQADKKVSSLPYAVAVNAGPRAEGTKLRMGANVPVPTTTFSPAGVMADGKAASPLVSYNYQNVGTNIDCTARPLGDGRYVIAISVEERSVVQPTAGATPAAPVIRNFETQNNLVLRDGQTRQFTAASDRVTGEVVKVDVTLKVVK